MDTIAIVETLAWRSKKAACRKLTQRDWDIFFHLQGGLSFLTAWQQLIPSVGKMWSTSSDNFDFVHAEYNLEIALDILKRCGSSKN